MASGAREVALVAGTTGGAIILIFLVFALIFFRMRSKQRRRELTDILAREERKARGAGGMGMLDGEAFDSLRGCPPQMQMESPRPQIEYHLRLAPDIECTAESPVSHALQTRSRAVPPFLFPRRASSSGSAFREEVWPPPQQESAFVDPLLHPPADDLVRIVDEVMGRSTAASSAASLPTRVSTAHSRQSSCSTLYAASPLPRTCASASTPTLPLPLSLLRRSTTDSDSRSEDDPPWPPTPGLLPGSTPPVSFWLRPGATAFNMQAPPLLMSKAQRPTTGYGSPSVKNWLERTPRPRERTTSHGYVRRAVSEGH
ncbi:hypothetical protein B0H15DRAFT_465235 [Mycena belliarum]|uniref:Uncharacterized protein n=1 Tax=Mycena belliarum TaxID=1033014 RepID=A0AAD6ULS3_9AGAR|nr:hypothetical protein B0H15DRAFT_465235 [Mycena belliae]